jgi:hypothetical protein
MMSDCKACANSRSQEYYYYDWKSGPIMIRGFTGLGPCLLNIQACVRSSKAMSGLGGTGDCSALYCRSAIAKISVSDGIKFILKPILSIIEE